MIQDAKVELQSLSHGLVALSVLRLNVFLLLRDVYYSLQAAIQLRTHSSKSDDQRKATVKPSTKAKCFAS